MTATERVVAPGVVLMGVGALYVALNLLALFLGVVSGVVSLVMNGITATSASGQDMTMLGVSAGYTVVTLGILVVVDLVGILSGAVVLFAGSRLMALRSPTFVIVGASLAVLQPILSVVAGFFGGCGCCGPILWVPLVVVGLGAGIWAVVSVLDPEIRDGFDAA